MRTIIFIAATFLFVACSAGSTPPEEHLGADGGDAGWINPDGGLPTGSCSGNHAVIEGELDRQVELHNGPCASDSDCTLVSRLLSCQIDCPVSALADAGAQLAADLEAYVSWACPLAGCPASAHCPAFDVAICHQGVCRRGYSDGGLAP